MLLIISLVSALNAAPTTTPDSVAGAWRVKSEVSGVAWEEVCTFKQAAAALTGTCTGNDGIPYALTGEVKEGKATYQHGGEYNGDKLTIIFTIDTASKAEMKGTIFVKPLDVAGTFTAAPEPVKP